MGSVEDLGPGKGFGGLASVYTNLFRSTGGRSAQGGSWFEIAKWLILLPTIWIGSGKIWDSLTITETHFVRVADWTKLWRTIFVVFVLIALIRFFNTATSESPLDPVKISGPEQVEGRLLGHQEGYWYLFNGKGTLVIIADEDAKRIKVYGNY